MKSKRLRIAARVIAFVFLLILVLILRLKYGWRLFGTRFCDRPVTIAIHQISVNEDEILLSGSTTSSMNKYDGYVLKIEGDTAYIGIKTRTFWASKNWGLFDLSIPLEAPVSKVVLKGGDTERVIGRRVPRTRNPLRHNSAVAAKAGGVRLPLDFKK